MFNRISTRLAAFGLATVVTLTMLSGIDALATQEHAATALARAQMATTQQFVTSVAVACRPQA